MNCSLLLSLLFTLPALAASRGAYEVPVPANLSGFARYEFDELRVSKKEDGRLEVRYQLPLALTGVENHLRFEGPLENGVAEMKNEQGAMTCVLAEGMCKVKYDRVEIDMAKAEAILRGMNLSEEEVQGHLVVTARFGGDMEGVLYFRELSL